jgi:hypothetical protein
MEEETWGGAAAVEGWGGAAAAEEADVKRGLKEVEATLQNSLPKKITLETYNEILQKIIKSRDQHPGKYITFFENILLPSKGVQPLVHAEFKEEGVPLRPNSAWPIYKGDSLFKNILEKQQAGRVSRPVEINSSIYEGKSSNAVSFSLFGNTPKDTKRIQVRGTKKNVLINRTIEAAVYNAFNKATPKDVKNDFDNNPENFPIYLIGAFPELGRHLTIVVFFQGILYSCGVASVGESATTAGAESEDGSNVGITMGGAAAASSIATGDPSPIAAMAIGSSSGIGTVAGRRRQIIGSGSSLSGQAQIISPDWMFDITDTRIFDIGILRPEHLLRLKAYFSKMTDEVIMTFKRAYEGDKFIGHIFDHLQFPLTSRFAPLSSPYVVNAFHNYLNCTTFVLSIFKDIECPTRFAGSAIVDPSECRSKKYLSLAQVKPADLKDGQVEELQKIIKRTLDSYKLEKFSELYKGETLFTRIKLWFLKQDPASAIEYRDRDSYVGIMLFRFIKKYINSKPGSEYKDPTLFSELVRDHNQDAGITVLAQLRVNHNLAKAAETVEAEAAEIQRELLAESSSAGAAAGGAAGGAGMSNEGGRRRRYPKRRTIRRRRMPKRRTHRRCRR